MAEQFGNYIDQKYIRGLKRPRHLVRVAEQLALPTSDQGVAGSNPTGGEILPKPKRRFIAQSLSCSPFHRLEMTEILLKGRKTLTHPTISEDLTLVVISYEIYETSLWPGLVCLLWLGCWVCHCS